MMVRGSKSSAVNLARLRRVNSRSRRSSSDRSSSFVSAGIEDARLVLHRGAALHAPTHAPPGSCTGSRCTLRRVNLLLRLRRGGSAGHPGEALALAAEDEPKRSTVCSRSCGRAATRAAGAAHRGCARSEGRDRPFVATVLSGSWAPFVPSCDARFHDDPPAEAQGSAHGHARLRRPACLPKTRARDATTMNADLVAAQLEEFRAALAEVNANVRRPLSRASSFRALPSLTPSSPPKTTARRRVRGF